MDVSVLKDRCILIAEDETLISLYLTKILGAVGADVVTSTSVAATLLAISDKIDGALLDVSLEDGEVFPAADQLSSLGIPVVFHSGHASDDRMQTRYPKAIALEKPAHKDELLGALVAVMGTMHTEDRR